MSRSLIVGMMLLAVLPASSLGQNKKKDDVVLTTEPLARFGAREFRHGSRIQSLLFVPKGAFAESPDQPLLVAGGGNDPIRIWNVETGAQIRTLDGPWVQGLAWNASDQTILAASAFRSLHVVKPREPASDAKFDVAPAGLKCVAVSPEGKPIVAGCQDGQLLLFQPQSKKATSSPGHKGEVNAVAAARSGTLFASGGGDRAIHLWKLSSSGDSLEKIRTLSPGGMVHALIFSTDDKTLISAGDDRVIRIWDVATGKSLHTLDGQTDTVTGLALSQDGKSLTAVSLDETLSIWDLDKRSKRLTIPIRFGDADAVALSPDGRLVAVAGGHQVIRLFDTQTGKERVLVEGPRSPLAKLALLPGAARLSALTVTGEMHQWDAKSTDHVKTWKTRTTPGIQQDLFLLASPLEPMILTGTSTRSSLELWNPSTGESRGELELPAGERLTSSAFAPSGKTLALGFRSGQIEFLEWPSRQLRAKAKASGPVSCVALADGVPVAASASGGLVQIWDAATGQPTRRFFAKEDTPENQQPGVAALAFSPNGRTLAVSGLDGAVRLMDWTTGKFLAACEGHASVATALAFAPDGRSFASASHDKTVRTWETFTGSPIAEWKDHVGPVVDVAYSRDGRTIYSAGVDGRIVAWDATGISFAGLPVEKIDGPRFDSIWKNLAGGDANWGQINSWRLLSSPKESVTFLAAQIYLLDPAKIDRLFLDLDAKEFGVRERATQELEKYGRWMEGRIETALLNPPSLESKRRLERMLALLRVNAALTLKQERARMIRVIQALEQMGDPAATKLLDDLARGAAEPELQREAELSLRRLGKK